MKNIYQNFCRTMIFNASALVRETIFSNCQKTLLKQPEHLAEGFVYY